ncbi:MAG TPA: hypothetical protein VGI39_07410 [Polyangiaceae bacterium]|jgi:hypothetical protein
MLSTANRTPRSLSTAKLAAAVLALAAVASYAPESRADETSISPTGKGVAGGALLGAEAVTIVESIANVRSPWAYVIGAVVGAGGGAVGGYFVEQNSSDGKAPVFMLAGGIGLIIPAVVLTLNATRYIPSETVVEDHAPTNGPIANPGAPTGNSVSPATTGVAPQSAPAPAPVQPTTPAATPPAPGGGGGGTAPPLSLFDVQHGTMRLGVPIPEVRPLFSMSELRQYGLAQQTEVRMPLVKIAF